MADDLHLPAALAALAAQGGDARGADDGARADWLDVLPRRTADLLDSWHLAPDGAARAEPDRLVVPVRDADGVARDLALALPDEGSEHEHVALQRWAGRGAVALARADPRRRALLLERLGGDLGDHWDVEACEVVAGLYATLHVPAGPQLRTLASYVETRAAALAREARTVPVPRRLVDQCLGLVRDLAADDADGDGDGDGGPRRLLHGDLHAATVREAPDGRWVAVSPRPLAGDPHAELEPALHHRFDDYAAVPGDSVRDGIRRRFHALVDVAGLDEDRARAWVVVRSVLRAHRVAADRGLVTRCVTVAKAVQD